MKTRDKVLITFGIYLLILFSLNDSVIAQNENIRVDDPAFPRQSLQTGETITSQGTFTVLIIQALGAILIVLFIIIYAVKKRIKRVANDKN